MLTKKNVVEFAHLYLLREAELKEDLSLTLETTLPRPNIPWTKQIISPTDDAYDLIIFLADLQKPGEIFNMYRLKDSIDSRLHKIPKDLYDEELNGYFTELPAK